MTHDSYSVKSFKGTTIGNGLPTYIPSKAARERYWSAVHRRESATNPFSRLIANQLFKRATKKVAPPQSKVAKVKPILPWPMVGFKRHPLRWTHNKAVLLVDAVVLGHVGLFIVAALYYLLFETRYHLGGRSYTLKHWWDTTVTPGSLRHDIRDVAEGVLAECFAAAVVWNPFKKGHRKAGRVFNTLNQRFHIPVVAAALLSAVLIGNAAFWILETIFNSLKVHGSNPHIVGSLWSRTYNSLWNADWNKKVLGFVAAFVAKRPLHVVYDELQAYFVNRRVAQGKKARFYHPPTFKARFNEAKASAHSVRTYSGAVNWVMGIGVVVALVLAGYGYYVLTYIA